MEQATKGDSVKSTLPSLTPRRPTAAQDLARTTVQDAFLDSYRTHGTISHAARDVGIDRATHYKWLNECPEYAEKWAEAQEDSVESLLREAIRRGRDGVAREVRYQGVVVGTEINYSDNLLMFMIKGRAPQYRDKMELSGPDGGPVQVQAVRSDALARLDAVQLEAIRRLNASIAGALPAAVVEDGEAVEAPAADDADAAFAPESDALKAKDEEIPKE